MKIVKLAAPRWAGNGFGTTGASYGIPDRPDIRIVRRAEGWYAYREGAKHCFGSTKAELEAQLKATQE